MPISDTTARRTLILGLVSCVPVWRLAAAAAPTTARSAVAPATSSLCTAVDELSGLLDVLNDARARADSADTSIGLLRASHASAERVADAVQKLELSLAAMWAQIEKIEQVAVKLRQLQCGPLSAVGNNANDAANCHRLSRQLFATGYLGSEQMAALARGKFQWTGEEIQAAIVRGRAASDQFIAPIAVRLRAQKSVIVPPSTLQPAPARRMP